MRQTNGVHIPAQPVDYGLHCLLTPLFGRDSERAEICARLRSPEFRLLTLTGQGGIGKTHLALQAAAAIQSSDGRLPGSRATFRDGVIVVHLESLTRVESILPAIVEALGLLELRDASPEELLINYLPERQLLLLIDGVEQLAAGAGVLPFLLAAAPDLRILATSQCRLNVQGEQVFHLAGLTCPGPLPADPEELAAAASVRLFLWGASRAHARPLAWPGDALEIARICRLVHGSPLGILLAANQTGTLAPVEIADQIEGGHGLDVLQADAEYLPVRQRSLRANLGHTWDLLGPGAQQVLRRLADLREHFGEEDARRVGASPGELRKLAEWSLLGEQSPRQYVLEGLVRQFVKERPAHAVSAVRRPGMVPS